MNGLNPTNLAERVILLEGWRAVILAVVAGAASTLALAPFHFFPILFFTIPIFVWLLDGSVAVAGARGLLKFWPAFKTGWLFGFGYFVAGLWWIGSAFLVDADEFVWLMPFAVLGLPALMAMYWGVAAALSRLAWSEGWKRLVAFAAIFTLLEFARGTLFSGFPWNLPGYAFMPIPAMMQSAALVGTYGLTFIVFFVTAAPAIFAPSDGVRPRRMRRVLATAAGLLIAHIGYGFVVLGSADDRNVPRAQIRLIQPNIDQKKKWEQGAAPEIFQTYLDLSRTKTSPTTATTAAFSHIIWPESAFPFILADQPDALAAIDDLLPDSTRLITGAMRRGATASDTGQAAIYNSTLLLNGAGQIVAHRDKTHLVPFGEYLPFQDTLESIGLRQLTKQRGGFAIGTGRQAVKEQDWPAWLPLICYEIIFPGGLKFNGDRPGWLINLTNDAWFGRSVGPYQHAHQSIVRGVEEGLPVIRVANSGISFVSDAYGRVRKSLPLGVQGVIDARIPRARDETLFAKTGNAPWLILICIVFLTLVGVRLVDTNRLQRQ